MKRCKAAQAAVENYARIFTDVKNALEVAMRDVQDKEIAARTLWADMSKNKPDDLWSQNSLIDDVNVYRDRYWSLRNEVGNKLDYIGQRLDYIITGCGLLPRER